MSKYKINIISTGKYLPTKELTNDDLSKMVDTSDEWIYPRTGIRVRKIADENETVVDLAYKSAQDAILKGNINKDEIDLIIVSTITNEVKNPSVANMVQKRLNIKGKVMSFDINAACTGFVYALEIASALVNTNFNKALVIGAEKMTNIVDFTDRNTCILFGDGAGSLIISKGNDETHFYNDSDGDLLEELVVSDYIKMDGRKVFKFAVDIIPKAINEVLNLANLNIDQIDYFLPHQANIRIIDAFVNKLNIDKNKVLNNIEYYGNTSAASIPILLDEYKEQNKKDKNNLLIVGFGGGFTWGSAIIKL